MQQKIVAQETIDQPSLMMRILAWWNETFQPSWVCNKCHHTMMECDCTLKLNESDLYYEPGYSAEPPDNGGTNV